MQPITMNQHSHPTSGVVTTPLKDIRKQLPLRVLSEADWQHWTTQGYVIVRQAVPADKVARLVDLLWQFDEKDPDDPSTWDAPQRRDHAMRELNHTGMLEIYNHQYLWDTRTEPRVYDAFVDIWDREDLWVTIDRANLNLPKKVKGNPNGFIHWDVDTTRRPLPIGVQGVLSLATQDDEVGGFQCVPELFWGFDAWVKTQPADRDPMHPDTTGLRIVNVSMEAGDLLIFNSLLAHGVRPNHSVEPPAHRAVHRDAPGRVGQRGRTRRARPPVARTGSPAASGVPGRPARVGASARAGRHADAARREAARADRAGRRRGPALEPSPGRAARAQRSRLGDDAAQARGARAGARRT